MKKGFSSATHGKLLWQKKGLLANPNLAGKGRIYHGVEEEYHGGEEEGCCSPDYRLQININDIY